MKRPYRPGDLFVVPMPDGTTADGIVVEMAGRSPLLGFYDPKGGLSFLARVDDRPLAVLRWPVVGRDTARNVERLQTSGRIEAPEVIEQCLQANRAGTWWHRPRYIVRDLRTPFDDESFAALPHNGWVQWREVVSESDLRKAAEWFLSQPEAGLRLFGCAAQNLDVLHWFPSLQQLALQARGPALRALGGLTFLRALALEGVPTDIAAIAETTIERIRIIGRADQTIDAAALSGVTNLDRVEMFGARVANVEALGKAPGLRALRLARSAGVKSLAWLAESNVTHLALEGLTHVDDLSPLAQMQHLEHLTIRGMWQFGVDEYGWIDGCAKLRGLSIDAGARRKTIEIYRDRRFAAALPYRRPSTSSGWHWGAGEVR